MTISLQLAPCPTGSIWTELSGFLYRSTSVSPRKRPPTAKETVIRSRGANMRFPSRVPILFQILWLNRNSPAHNLTCRVLFLAVHPRFFDGAMQVRRFTPQHCTGNLSPVPTNEDFTPIDDVDIRAPAETPAT